MLLGWRPSIWASLHLWVQVFNRHTGEAVMGGGTNAHQPRRLNSKLQTLLPPCRCYGVIIEAIVIKRYLIHIVTSSFILNVKGFWGFGFWAVSLRFFKKTGNSVAPKRIPWPPISYTPFDSPQPQNARDARPRAWKVAEGWEKLKILPWCLMSLIINKVLALKELKII